ncbi:hypothetical protein AURDEDRAFT_159678 [Auricularia subglabra TFB-10046 SS5]|nr:hypothetical protein AURDEDRAFT_159678 [Auricularia subglabra TFB-10046 SS5]
MYAKIRGKGQISSLYDVDAHSRDILDLYDLAVLLTYERWTVHPMFRDTKLTDLAFNTADFLAIRPEVAEWHNPARAAHRRGFYFTQLSDKSEARDLPETMLADPLPPGLQYFSSLQRETLFYQARAVSSSAASVSLLGHLMALFPADQILRIRNGDGGVVYARGGDIVGERYTLHEPGPLVLSIVRHARSNAAADAPVLAFGELPSEQHCVVSLPTRVGPGSSGIAQPVVLDLSSLVFGDAGRPFGGKGLFALETRVEYERRLRTVAMDITDPDLLGKTAGVLDTEEETLREIARKVSGRAIRAHP